MFNKLIKDSTITKALHSKEMGSAAVHVLHYFSFSVNKQNMVAGTPKELAKSFRMSILQFNQGVQMLKKLQVIKKYTKKEYMLNPDIAYSGDDKRYYILKHMWDTQTTRGLRNL